MLELAQMMQVRIGRRLRWGALCVAVVVAIAFGAFLYLFPWAFDNQAEPGVAGPAIPVISMVNTGQPPLDAYARTCSYCHDRGIGPDLRAVPLDTATVQMFVRHGSGPMPAFRASEISDNDLAALAKMIADKHLPAVKQ